MTLALVLARRAYRRGSWRVWYTVTTDDNHPVIRPVTAEAEVSMIRCQAKWDGVHCNGDGVERFVIGGPAHLTGAQLKLNASQVYICDVCWSDADKRAAIERHFMERT